MGKKFSGKGKGRQCSFCSKQGHTIDTCYKKRGFLLSIPRLNWSSSYSVEFSGDICVIQDHSLSGRLVSCRIHNGLYQLEYGGNISYSVIGMFLL